jgi:diguanylate cyclase (GGDEF)-like protein
VADPEHSTHPADRRNGGGVDPGASFSAEGETGVRTQSDRQRRQGASARADSATTRDSVAEARDLAATARDRAAAGLDREPDDPVLEAESRGRAAADREQAAGDRVAAAEDRRQAHADRDALLRELAVSELDALTGALTRGPGLADLDHEIDRARRTANGLLAIAYIDVVGLKEVNNERGHSAGDELLRDVIKVIRAHLRSYDVIVRVGGDEFVCVISSADVEGVRGRFESVQATLAATGGGCKIKFGIAKLTPSDTGPALIDRADAQMQRRG